MKLLHWNVHMWRDSGERSNVDAVTELILRHSPDVVSLVEVDEPWGAPDSLRRVADAAGYAWVFAPSFEYRTQGGFGNALLSRFPLHTVEHWHLLTPRLYDGSERSEQRALLVAQISTADGVSVSVGTTHLPRGDALMRAEAASRLLDLLRDRPEPWIVCGDFNQPASTWLPDSTSIGWTSVGPTYPTTSPTEPIDYCLTAGMTATAEILDSESSDHLPILVTASVGSTSTRG